MNGGRAERHTDGLKGRNGNKHVKKERGWEVYKKERGWEVYKKERGREVYKKERGVGGLQVEYTKIQVVQFFS